MTPVRVCGVWLPCPGTCAVEFGYRKGGLRPGLFFLVWFVFFVFPRNLLSNREEEFKMKSSGETLKWLKEESLQKSVFS